ncbi:hypothetical protein FB45DRAFT_892030 [Roridomyces roridus]|uniref:Uncharacterized protein n=1 Tax=Roridomyces roridus TaxID=1738132 RepID=A0AAD7B5Q9_9AGAR|nr:hypothetical protein FB45DRAFT_941834 [Roridomyces roridus]KAJ7634676.1 hypothetical protein FB45DRAFT_471646 [Roridomyces roridus]KAJ7646999.1 hypothetical protein FB45DRAFT_892030 [Roridomyces roridus]
MLASGALGIRLSCPVLSYVTGPIHLLAPGGLGEVETRKTCRVVLNFELHGARENQSTRCLTNASIVPPSPIFDNTRLAVLMPHNITYCHCARTTSDIETSKSSTSSSY